MSGCEHTSARIWAALDGELSFAERRELDAHVTRCARCASEQREARRLHEALQRAAAVSLAQLDVERSAARIQAEIDRTAPDRVAPGRSGPERSAPERGAASGSVSLRPVRTDAARRWLWRAAAVAATVLVAGALVVWVLHERRDASRSSGSDAPLVVEQPERTPQPRAQAPEAPLQPEATPSSPPEVAGAGQETPAEPAPSAPVLALPDLDVRELEAARADVRAALLGERGSLAYPASFALAVDERLRASGRSRWPIVRLAEAYATATDPELAEAALVYIGVRSDALALRTLQAALTDPARKQAAVEGLVAAGSPGLSALAGALADDALRPRALQALRDAGLEASAPHVERALRTLPTSESRVAALDVLLAPGHDGVRRLLALESGGVATSEDVAAAVAQAHGAPAALVSQLDELTDLAEQRAALRLLARLAPAGTEDWIEEVARRSGRRADGEVLREAASALAALDSAQSLAVLLRLPALSRADRDAVERALSDRIETSAAGVAQAAQGLCARREQTLLRALHAAVTANPRAELVPALTELGLCAELSVAERRWAILLAGENGGPQDLAELLALYGTLDRSERELRAAALVALFSATGREGVLHALASASPRTQERILAVLEARDARARPATTQSRLVRELKPILPDVHP